MKYYYILLEEIVRGNCKRMLLLLVRNVIFFYLRQFPYLYLLLLAKLDVKVGMIMVSTDTTIMIMVSTDTTITMITTNTTNTKDITIMSKQVHTVCNTYNLILHTTSNDILTKFFQVPLQLLQKT